jgi:hypothetical protein
MLTVGDMKVCISGGKGSVCLDWTVPLALESERAVASRWYRLSLKSVGGSTLSISD